MAYSKLDELLKKFNRALKDGKKTQILSLGEALISEARRVNNKNVENQTRATVSKIRNVN